MDNLDKAIVKNFSAVYLDLQKQIEKLNTFEKTSATEDLLNRYTDKLNVLKMILKMSMEDVIAGS